MTRRQAESDVAGRLPVPVVEEDGGAVAFDHDGHGASHLGGHFGGADEFGQRRGQFEKLLRRVGLVSRFVHRVRGVEGGGRQPAVRREGVP